jgi:hypothetical protein
MRGKWTEPSHTPSVQAVKISCVDSDRFHRQIGHWSKFNHLAGVSWISPEGGVARFLRSSFTAYMDVSARLEASAEPLGDEIQTKI